MAIEAVKIPQNVYVEDRIIGPVTLRQLMITGAGAGISYALYATASKGGGTLPILIASWIPAVIAAAFAFFKINDLTLFNIILLIIESMNKPSLRTWSPHAGLSINLITRQSTKEFTEINARAATNAAKLADMTRQMEKRQLAFSQLASAGSPDSKREESSVPDTRDASVDSMQDTEPRQPVRTDRVQTSGLDPERSIDNVNGGISAYEALVSPSSLRS